MSLQQMKLQILDLLETGKAPSYKSLSDELKEDTEITKAFCNKLPFFIRYAPNSFRKNKSFVLTLIEKDPYTFHFIDPSLKEDVEFVSECIEKSKGMVYFLCKDSIAALEKIKEAARSCGLRI